MFSNKYIETYTHDGRIGVIVEIACETSIPRSDEEFRLLAKDIAMHIAAVNPKDVSELLQQGFIIDVSIENLVQRAIQKYSENMKITRFIRWDTEPVRPEPDDPPPKSPAVAMRVVK